MATPDGLPQAWYPSLRNRRILITGGGSGIGEALVEAFADQGARVAFVDIAEAPSRAVVARLDGKVDHTPLYLQCDLTDLNDVDHAVENSISTLGGLDTLINNAGNDDRHSIDEVDPAYYERRMAVNLHHYFFASRATIPALKASSSGSIINFGSISWHVALPNLVIYQTAKAAIEGLTASPTRDLGKEGIRVNAILPGAVDTPRQKCRNTAEDEDKVLDAQCLPIRITPADVAALALFLASDNARACTAGRYFVDAGWK